MRQNTIFHLDGPYRTLCFWMYLSIYLSKEAKNCHGDNACGLNDALATAAWVGLVSDILFFFP